MRLSLYSDFALRLLMFAAYRHPERCTIDEVAGAYGVSRHHLVKVVHDLGRAGFLETFRGVGGGFCLGRPPEEISVGAVVRLGEENERVIDCARAGDQRCVLTRGCELKRTLDRAEAAFFEVLDGTTLSDLVARSSGLPAVVQAPKPGTGRANPAAEPGTRRRGPRSRADARASGGPMA